MDNDKYYDDTIDTINEVRKEKFINDFINSDKIDVDAFHEESLKRVKNIQREEQEKERVVSEFAKSNIDFDELHKQALEKAKNNQSEYNCVAFDKPVEVKKKLIKNEKLKKVATTALKIVAVVGFVAFIVIEIADFEAHPEEYLTTHPDFKGGPELFASFKRAPENLAPLFNSISEYIADHIANIKGKGM